MPLWRGIDLQRRDAELEDKRDGRGVGLDRSANELKLTGVPYKIFKTVVKDMFSNALKVARFESTRLTRNIPDSEHVTIIA